VDNANVVTPLNVVGIKVSTITMLFNLWLVCRLLFIPSSWYDVNHMSDGHINNMLYTAEC